MDSVVQKYITLAAKLAQDLHFLFGSIKFDCAKDEV